MPFDPTQITGLQAWYKADAGTVFSDPGVTSSVDAGAVAQWNDSSGNARAMPQARPRCGQLPEVAKAGSIISLAKDAAKTSLGLVPGWNLTWSTDNNGNTVKLPAPDITALGLDPVNDEQPYVNVLTIKVTSTGAGVTSVYLNGTQIGSSFQTFNDFSHLLIGPAFNSPAASHGTRGRSVK